LLIEMINILFVDSQNFIKKLKEVFVAEGVQMPDLSLYDFDGLFNKALQGIVLNRRIFYSGKLLMDEENRKKSYELIQRQRIMKNKLEEVGFEFLISGRVRPHLETDFNGRMVKIFKEKGVDVRMAVDMVSLACDGNLKTAVIASSDSDLQPAVKELKNRGVELIYLGFEISPNKGLTFTTDRTILIRNAEVIEFFAKTLI